MFISYHREPVINEHVDPRNASNMSCDQSHIFTAFSKSLSNKFFPINNPIPIDNFESNITNYSTLTNTIFRKHNIKKSNNTKVTLRCFYFKKNGANKSSFISSCQFKLVYEINRDSVFVLNIVHEHNHLMMNNSDFNEIQARNKLNSLESDLNHWMETSVIFNSQKDSLSLTPKNIRKLLEKENLIDLGLKKMIDENYFLKKKFDNMVNKIKAKMKRNLYHKEKKEIVNHVDICDNICDDDNIYSIMDIFDLDKWSDY